MKPYAVGAGITAASTAVCFLASPYVDVRDLVMIYLMGTVAVSTTFGLWPSVATAAMSVLALDFFFVPPYWAFGIADASHLVTIGVMFVVAVIMGGLTDRVRFQGELSRLREQRMGVLYAISRDLSAVRDPTDLCLVAQRHVSELFDCSVVFLLGRSEDALKPLSAEASGFVLEEVAERAAHDAWTKGTTIIAETERPGTVATISLPLTAPHGTVGVLCIRPRRSDFFGDSEQRALLETVARLIASSLQNALLAREANQTRLQIEAERLRSGLLSSVSHDLRTPLATIEGAATTMLQESAKLTPLAREELTRAIVEEAHRLGRLVRNLLDMTRLESGQLRPNKERQDVEELVGGALTRVEGRLQGRPVRTHIDDRLPFVPMDAVLVEQVLINLLENAIRHSPPSGAIEISARLVDRELLVEVTDTGSGLTPGTEERIFEKFYRGDTDEGGAGLGLSICRAIVSAHGGRIWAETRPQGGSTFQFVLPLGESVDEEPPTSVRET
ncbi:MAG TPA: ATP-binding protein [Polyangiaceae bacterium]